MSYLWAWGKIRYLHNLSEIWQNNDKFITVTQRRRKFNLLMTECPSTVLVKLFLYLFYNCCGYHACMVEIFENFSGIDHFLTSYGWTFEQWCCSYCFLLLRIHHFCVFFAMQDFDFLALILHWKSCKFVRINWSIDNKFLSFEVPCFFQLQ